jgi:serine/threonine protein kinase
MEPERWCRVEQLYHSALKVAEDQRATFLKDECQADEELRQEVESLLSYESSAAGFIESPAFDVVARLIAGDKADEQAVGRAIGPTSPRFRVLDKLGAGGMGVVYKAEDTKLRRTVALKFLPSELSRDPQSLERFQREAYAASALNHPNICTVYDVDEYQGQPFIAMELLEGQTLEHRIGTQPLPTPELLELSIQISDALDAAHARGIIHRDIKPSNIFVTTRGHAKILDFGLAKQQDSEIANSSAPTAAGSGPAHVSNLSITRTGTAMGTAGYMSPEQVRGERLDARTDLFSFGLVLYEMATGQRAFTGNTRPVLHEAILKQMPSSARQINPELPAKLGEIVNRSLEKDREARYQTASEMRSDLENVKRTMEAKHSVRGRGAALALAAAFLIASTIFWMVKRRPGFPLDQPELKLQQLTANSFENRVLNGAISPDGKYLAYTDMKGMHIKLTATGGTRNVPQPFALSGKNFDWEINPTGWFPDSTRFVANARPPFKSGSVPSSAGTSIWLVSVLGVAPKKLRDNAVSYSVSPDGSLISFGTNQGKLGDREIWLMRPDGEKAQKLYAVGEDTSISGLNWTPDGQRVLYFKTDGSTDGAGDTVVSRDLKGGPTTTFLSPSKLKEMGDLSLLPDGRLIYSVKESQPMRDSCNYWITRIDARTGQTIEQPRKLTHWTGFCMNSTGATADGKRVAFLQWKPHLTSYVADLASRGMRLSQLRHFPLSDTMDAATDWTADSREIILAANRTGHFGIYKQSLDGDTAEPLVTEGYGRNPRVTPDGKSIVYLGIGENGPWPARGPEPVMRVAIGGGRSQLLFMARPSSLISCARSPSDLCVITEPSEDRQQAIVTTLDPLKGRGAEVTRFHLDSNDDDWWVDLSPDGTRLVTIRSPTSPIEILFLRGGSPQQIKVKGWSNLLASSWASDGKSVFVVSGVRGRRTVLHVDFQGNARILWETSGGAGETLAIPSPDGRHLAIQNWTAEGNMWMMENF